MLVKLLRNLVKEKYVTLPWILPLPPKTGGALPFLIPPFAGFSATRASAGGAAGIAKAVNDAKAAKKNQKKTSVII